MICFRIVLLFCILCLILLNSSYANTMDFLNVPIGARPIGMGGAFSALADDVNAVNYNPAGLGYNSNTQLEYTHGIWFNTLNYENIAFVHPLFSGGLGINLFYLHMPSFKETDYKGETGKEIFFHDIGITAGYGNKIADIDVGLNIKYASSKLDNSKAQMFALDIGGHYKLFFPSINRDVDLSLVLKNLGSSVQYEKKREHGPANMVLGLHLFLLQMNKHRISMTGDFSQLLFDDLDSSLSVGLEYMLYDIVSFRSGYKFNTDTSGITGGIGVKYYNIDFNYALYPFGDLGVNHIFSVNFRLFKIVDSIQYKHLENSIESAFQERDYEGTMNLCYELLEKDKDNKKAHIYLKKVKVKYNEFYLHSYIKYDWKRAIQYLDLLLQIEGEKETHLEQKRECQMVLNDKVPPEILIDGLQDEDKIIVKERVFNLTGIVQDNMKLREVRINNKQVLDVQQQTCSINEKFDIQDDQDITIIAIDLNGNMTKKIVRVVVEK